MRPFKTAALIAAMASSGRLAAQISPPPDTATKIGAVIVTATRSTTTLEEMPLHATVVTHENIGMAPSQTLDQLLREVSGIIVPCAPFYTTDPTGHQTKLRGVTNSKVLVLIDGIPVLDPFYGTTQWFKMPLSTIERVEVVRGGSSSLWGNIATAGVVNIITKKPIDNSTQLDVNYQSMSTANVAGAKNFSLADGLSLRVSGDFLSTDGYQTTPNAYLSAVPGKGHRRRRGTRMDRSPPITHRRSHQLPARRMAPAKRRYRRLSVRNEPSEKSRRRGRLH